MMVLYHYTYYYYTCINDGDRVRDILVHIVYNMSPKRKMQPVASRDFRNRLDRNISVVVSIRLPCVRRDKLNNLRANICEPTDLIASERSRTIWCVGGLLKRKTLLYSYKS